MSMSKEDLELMALLLEEEGFELEQEEAIPPRDPDVTPMLSYSQQRLWFVYQLEPENPAYNISSDVRMKGTPNVEVLERCFNEIIRRHEVLRTTFHNENGVPVQQFHDHVTLSIPVIDLSGLPKAERDAEVTRLLTKEVTTPFDLTVAPLMRLTLLKLEEFEWVLSLSIHHIVSDGWSSGVFINEMAALYEAYLAGKPSPLPELAIQFADFAHWHRNWFTGEVAEEQTAYWKQKLSGELPVLNLPSDRPRPLGTSFGGAMYKFMISEDIKQKLVQLGREVDATMFMILLAAYNIQLSRYTGQEDLIVGSPIANRTRSELEPLIGFLANTIVFRSDLSRDPSFREMLRRTQEMALDAYAHQEMPFVRLVEEVSPDRSLAASPLVQSFFVLQNAPMPEVHLTDLTLSLSAIESRTAKFDVSLYLMEEEQGISAAFEYNTDLFDESTMARWAEHTLTLLDAVTQHPDLPLSQISMLGEVESQKVLHEWNDNAMEYRQDATIAQLFDEQAARTPDAEAVVFGEERMTYRELQMRADHVARFLRGQGVGPEVLVGIHVERSLEMVVGLLGILKAGGAYVPLDPAYPAERLGFILDDAQATILLTQERLLGSLPDFTGQTICLDRDWAQIEAGATEPANGAVAQANHLAYLIYTSGSTGRPKGVAIEHRNAVAMIEWAKTVYSAEQLAGVLAATSICFDLSVFELFLTLSVGGKVIVAENALEVPNLPAREEITLINTVPSAITELVRLQAIPSSVRTINLAGEPLRRALVDQLYEIETVEKVYNLYGPSEDTTYSTYTLVNKGDASPVTIGRPIANTEVYLLDPNGQPVPIGVPGELHLSGDGLARGYLHREELTQEKFIANPFSNDPASRLYKTGDLVRYLPNGELEYMGRIDHQVKVRGFRIELGEIETVLSRHEAIRESVVLAREDAHGEKRLVSYLVAEAGLEVPSVGDLRAHLSETLPDYMIPSVFVPLAEMPLTPNGKVDRRALPAPEDLDAPRTVDYVAPRNEREATLAAICAELLGLEQVGVYDNFFELGGHSLLATQLMSRVRQVFGVELPLRSLFKDPTVNTLAETIAEQQARQNEGAAAGKPALKSLPREKKAGEAHQFLASYPQQRLWFLEQFLPGNTTFNVPSVVRLSGQLDVAALEQSFAELIRRHEPLRTTFDMVDGELMQIVHSAAAANLHIVDLQALSPAEQDARIRELSEEELTRPFDLVHGPLMRTTLLKQSEQEHVLLIMKHHIITDGWSMGIFFYELTTLYATYAKGDQSPLPELSIQYADYAHWQREWLQGEALENQLSYWREQLGGELPVLQLPTDFPRPPMQNYRGQELVFSLPKSLADGLTTWSQGEGVTLFMTLLGAFQTLLYRYTGQEDILVGSPIAGRNDADIESIIGFFVNTLVMRTDLSGDPTFRELVARVSEVALGAYGHQELPFEKLVEELQPERNTAHAPVFQVMFVLQNTPSEFSMELPGLTMSVVESHSGSSQFDLLLTLTERETELFGKWQFNTDLFEEATARRMIAHFQTLLEDILAHPDKRLSELNILPAVERQKLLVEFNQFDDNGVEAQTDICIHQLVAEQVARTPDADALVWGEERLTYRELDRRAERVASYLRRRGVGPEVLVGINVERTLEMVIGMLGILKAGGAYVPLDPAYPADRLGFILEDAQASVLLTQEHLLGRLPEQAAHVVCLDRDWALIEADATSPLENADFADAQAHNLAYVIYTSGSTGRPKGVAIEHRNVAALIGWAKGEYAPEQLAGVLASTSICFDLSVFELFVTLSMGGKVILAENALHLPTLPAREEVTLINTVPSAITELLRLEAIPSSVRTVNLAGEPLRRALVERIYELGTVDAVYNLYGPSEDTTYSTFIKVERGNEVTIGRPISGTQAYLLDEKAQPVPLGVPGELHLGGEGVARGYLNRAELTVEKFITDPFADEDANRRLYKTGDLARYRANGALEYLGRIDHQVKIRGFRIELGEIESVLGQHAAIRETVLLAREDEPGEKRLVAYIVPAQELAPTVEELRSYLSETLPEYMIPSVFLFLDEMPLTPNGKVDRKRLPAPDDARGNQGSTYVAPRDRVEMDMVALWEEVLQVKPIGVHDNFFALGGHSLKALSLVGEISKRFDVELPIVTLFQALTVADLCQRVRGEVETTPNGCLVPLQQGDGTRNSLFLVHPQSGGVFCYFGLSRQLGAEETVYGLQAPGYEGEKALLTSIEAMADHYVEEIRRVKPQGPYRLAGWSLGGTIVYEMARRLEAQGEQVEFLGLIDVHTFGEGHVIRTIEPLDSDWTELSALKHLARSMNMDTAIFDELDLDQGLKAMLTYADEHGVLPHGITTDTTWTQMRVQITNQVALDAYRWEGPIATDVHLFCATDLDRMHHALVDPQDWINRTTGTIHVDCISGDHHTIVEPPHVFTLAEKMKQALERVCK